MSFLLDTDICSAQLKGIGSVANRFLQYGGRLHISTVSVTELYSWAARRSAPMSRQRALHNLLTDLTILPVDETIARTAGSIRAALLDVGRNTSTTDLLIAGTALEHDLTLVTHNVRDFAAVPGLRIEDWLIA